MIFGFRAECVRIELPFRGPITIWEKHLSGGRLFRGVNFCWDQCAGGNPTEPLTLILILTLILTLTLTPNRYRNGPKPPINAAA